MGSRRRKCYLCGESYQYCPTCYQDRLKPAYMANFHDFNCKEIFDICTRFNMGLISKEEAKSALEKCDLSNKENFAQYVQKDLENIFADENKSKKSKKAEHEVVTIKE